MRSPLARVGACALGLLVVLGGTGGAPVPATAPASATTAQDRWTVASSATITIAGHGYGHGHGMSQHGAEGAARQGLTAQQIVDFYYPGTGAGRAAGRVSVLITADTTDDLVVLDRDGLRVRDLGTGQLVPLDGVDAARWRLQQADGATRLAYLPPGRGARWTRHATLRGEGEVHAGNHPVTLVLPGGAQRAYRGKLRAAAPTPGSQARDTVNRLRLEDYLRGVVPLEVPAVWSPAAVQAQAIAARSYAAYERAHPRAAHAQICDTTSCQVYGGVAAEHPASDAAIAATKGQVRTDGGEPAFTQFSSSSGGWTAAGSRPYLPAQEDPYDGWDGNSVHAWQVTVTDQRIEQVWPGVGDLRRIEVVARDGNGRWGGRVTTLRLVGGRGTVTVSGDAFRSGLGLRSTWVTFRVS